MIGKGLESLLPKKGMSDGKSFLKETVVLPGADEPPLVPQSRSVAHSDHPARSVSDALSHPIPRTPKKVNEESIFHIEVEKITPNPYQPRRAFSEEGLEELAASIREFGILQPLVVTKRVEETGEGTKVIYELIAGERRLLAARRAGLERVPAIVKSDHSHRAKLEVALIENLQRRDLSALETARAYARLQEEFGITQREIGERVGKSREAVANTLRLLQLPPDVLHALAEGKITESQARALLAGKSLKVRGRPATSPLSPEDAATVRAIEEKLGAPVKVVRTKKGGSLIITFYSDEEFRGVRSRLLGEDY